MNFKTFYLILVPCLLSLVALSAQAAEMKFLSGAQQISIGSDVKVDVFLLTEREDVNAVEARIVYPPNLMELREIRDGGSVVSLWVERPRKESGGSVSFSGIIPGGFADEKGLLLSLVFRAVREGKAVVDAEDMKVLLNDGEGTETRVHRSPLSISLSAEPSLPAEEISKDSVPPEQFTPYVSEDANLFEGKHFLVFSTTDKDTGIDRYEVGEVVPDTEEESITWKVAESPYLLEDQELSRDIYVRAVDRAGNFIVARVPARHPKKEAPSISFVVMVLLVIVALVAVLRFATQWTASKRRRQG